MTYLHLNHKIQYINKELNQTVLIELEKTLYTHINTFTNTDNEIFSKNINIKTAIFVDIIYAILKHRIWLQEPSFVKEITSTLTDSYNLTESSCFELVLLCSKKIRRTSQFRNIHYQKGHSSFLLSYFLKALKSNKSKDLISDLGLGSNFLLSGPIFSFLRPTFSYLSAIFFSFYGLLFFQNQQKMTSSKTFLQELP